MSRFFVCNYKFGFLFLLLSLILIFTGCGPV